MSYTTKKSLLEAIQHGDQVSWSEFYDTYRPLIILRGRDFHLSADELEDLCQMVIIDIFKMGTRFQYDSAKGRFRDYLRRIISNNALDLLRRRPDNLPLEGNDSEGMENSHENRWEQEWQHHLLKQALMLLRSQVEIVTYQAFELYAVQGQDAEKVAAFLNIKVNMVYVAKSRVLPKLRRIIQRLREE